MRIKIVQKPNVKRIDGVRVEPVDQFIPEGDESRPPSLTPSQARRAIIERLRFDALRQLTRARRAVMKHQIALASRDLEAGLAWLEEEGADSNALILEFVDLTIELASWRLELVNNALDKYGPDAMLLG
jgi:hypothetical protein